MLFRSFLLLVNNCHLISYVLVRGSLSFHLLLLLFLFPCLFTPHLRLLCLILICRFISAPEFARLFLMARLQPLLHLRFLLFLSLFQLLMIYPLLYVEVNVLVLDTLLLNLYLMIVLHFLSIPLFVLCLLCLHPLRITRLYPRLVGSMLWMRK